MGLDAQGEKQWSYSPEPRPGETSGFAKVILPEGDLVIAAGDLETKAGKSIQAVFALDVADVK